MNQSIIKQSDWKAIDLIEDEIDLFHSAEQSDDETLDAIKDILVKFGYLKVKNE